MTDITTIQEDVIVKQSVNRIFAEILQSKQDKREPRINKIDVENAKLNFKKNLLSKIKWRILSLFALLILSNLSLNYITNTYVEKIAFLIIFAFVTAWLIEDEFSEIGYLERYTDTYTKTLTEMRTLTYYIFDFAPLLRYVRIAFFSIFLFSPAFFIPPQFQTAYTSFIVIISMIIILFFNILFIKKEK
jgi:hypothetical protein